MSLNRQGDAAIPRRNAPAATPALLGVLLTKVKRTKLDQDIRDHLLSVFKDGDLFRSDIGDSVRHREATLYGKSIHEHAPGEVASEQYLTLADEIIERVGNPQPLNGPRLTGKEEKTPSIVISKNLAVPKPSQTTAAVGEEGEV